MPAKLSVGPGTEIHQGVSLYCISPGVSAYHVVAGRIVNVI